MENIFHLPASFIGDNIAVFAFGIVAIVVLAIGYKVFDKMTPKAQFEEEITKGNTAMAILVAGILIAIAIIVASIGHAVLS